MRERERERERERKRKLPQFSNINRGREIEREMESPGAIESLP